MSSADEQSWEENSSKNEDNTGKENGDEQGVIQVCDRMSDLCCDVDQKENEENGARLSGNDDAKDELDVEEACKLLAYLCCTRESSQTHQEGVAFKKEGSVSCENGGKLVRKVDLVSCKQSTHPLDKCEEFQQYTSDEGIGSREENGTYEQDVDEARELLKVLHCSCGESRNENRDTQFEGRSDMGKCQKYHVDADCLPTRIPMQDRYEESFEDSIDVGFGSREGADKYEQDLAEACTLLTTLRCKCEGSQEETKEDVLANGEFGGRADDGKYEEDLAEACERLKTLQCKCEEIRKDIKKDNHEDGSDDHKYKEDLAKACERLKTLQCRCEGIRENIQKDVLGYEEFGSENDDAKYKQDLAEACKRLKTLQCKCEVIRKEIRKDVVEDGRFGSEFDDAKYEKDIAKTSEQPTTLLCTRCGGIRKDTKVDVVEDGDIGSVQYEDDDDDDDDEDYDDDDDDDDGTCEPHESFEKYVDYESRRGRYFKESEIEKIMSSNWRACTKVEKKMNEVSKEPALLDCSGSQEYEEREEEEEENLFVNQINTVQREVIRNNVAGEKDHDGESQPEIEGTCERLKVLNVSSHLDNISETDKMKKNNTRLIKRRIVNGDKRVTWVTTEMTKKDEMTWLNKTKEMGWEMTPELEDLMTVREADKISTSKGERPEEMMHPDTQCDVCRTHPMRGIRYKCWSCPDCDICSSCKEKGRHGEHGIMVEPAWQLERNAYSEQHRLKDEILEKIENTKVRCAIRDVVRGMAIWNEKLYVAVRSSGDIDVYETGTFVFQRKITVPDLSSPWDIAAHADHLFISEREEGLIHRIHLPDDTYSSLNVDGTMLTMSITAKGNILVSCCMNAKIFEYQSDGTFVRLLRINRLDLKIGGLKHAIQLDEDRLLILLTNRVCIMDNTARVLCYSARKDDIWWYGHLAVDEKGSVLIVDSVYRRVLQLSPSLKFIRDLIPPSVCFKRPCHMIWQQQEGRMYISDKKDLSITLFDFPSDCSSIDEDFC